MTTIKQALETGYSILSGKESADLETQILLAYSLGKDRAYLYTHPEQSLSTDQVQQFETLLERRGMGEPVAYITGQREFWGLALRVTPATLIPRAESERLVEIALDRIPIGKTLRIADLGTGSGAIALAIAKERPECQVIATDISKTALDIAMDNAEQHALSNVSFIHGSWCDAFKNEQFDLIISNPPYVESDDPHLDRGDLRFEPYGALSSGPDGLLDIRKIIGAAPEHLTPGGWLILEHGYRQGDAVTALMSERGFIQVNCYQDYGSRERASAGQLPV